MLDFGTITSAVAKQCSQTLHFLLRLIASGVVCLVSTTVNQLLLHSGHFIKNQTEVAWLESVPKILSMLGCTRLQGFPL